MFPSASIAFTFLAALSGIVVRSAPVVLPRLGAETPQGCTEVNGGGSCFPLPASPPGVNTRECTNFAALGVKSLVFDDDDECLTYVFPDCQLGPDAENINVGDLIKSSSLNLGKDIKSVECFH